MREEALFSQQRIWRKGRLALRLAGDQSKDEQNYNNVEKVMLKSKADKITVMCLV